MAEVSLYRAFAHLPIKPLKGPHEISGGTVKINPPFLLVALSRGFSAFTIYSIQLLSCVCACTQPGLRSSRAQFGNGSLAIADRARAQRQPTAGLFSGLLRNKRERARAHVARLLARVCVCVACMRAHHYSDSRLETNFTLRKASVENW